MTVRLPLVASLSPRRAKPAHATGLGGYGTTLDAMAMRSASTHARSRSRVEPEGVFPNDPGKSPRHVLSTGARGRDRSPQLVHRDWLDENS